MTSLTLKPGQNYTLAADTYSLVGDVPYWGIIEGVPGTVITGPQRLYFRSDGTQNPTTLRKVRMSGTKLYIDRVGGMNENITVDDVEFMGGAGIETMSGLKNSTIKDCLFDHHPGHPIYGHAGYSNLVVANCDFLSNRGGIHLDAPLGSGSNRLLLSELYWEGLTAIGIELQTQSIDNPILQDITFKTLNIQNPTDCAPISAPLDAGKGAIIRRCWFAAGVPTYDVEGGGDAALYEDNYSASAEQGAQPTTNFTTITDKRGTWSVIVRNNRIAVVMKIGATNGMGTLTQGGNGPLAPLTWDINRQPGRRHYRLVAAPIPTPPSHSDAEFNAVVKQRDDAYKTIDEIHAKAVHL